MACDCNCGKECGVTLLYSCSGAANTGYLADQVWRKMMADNAGAGTCIAAVGADLSGFIKSAAEADRNIIFDGCAVGCGRKMFENKGLPYTQIIMTDFGVVKGKTDITAEVIHDVSSRVKDVIGKANG